jgi:MFS family permease
VKTDASRTLAAPSDSHRALLTTAILLSLVVAALESTVVTTAMPKITDALGGRALYGWVFSAFLVANAVSVLVCGKLADGLGRRPTFALGVGLFIVGSLASASATSVPMLIACRALQGLGAGGIQPVAMTITTDLYSLEERARIQGMLTGAWGAGNVVGPLIGGTIVAHASWRWVFVVPAPFALLAAIVVLAAYRDRPRVHGAHLGLGGAALAGLAVSLSLLALEPRFEHRLVALIAAVIATTLLAITQRTADVPLLPRRILVDPIVRTGLVSSVFAGGLLYLGSAYVPLWMLERTAHDARFAGVPLVCLLGGWAVGSTFGVRVLVTHGLRTSTLRGYGLAFLSALALVLAARSDHLWPSLIALTGVGAGLGPAASTSLVAPQNRVEPGQRGSVTSAIYAARMLGGSTMIATFGALAPHESAVRLAFPALALVAFAALAALFVVAPKRV